MDGKKKVGRPSVYSEALVERICMLIAEGQSLRAICQEDGVPELMTINRWLGDGKHEDFVSKYARAREMQADAMDDKILQIANGVLAKRIDPNAARVAIAAFQWRAEKLKPKVYGARKAFEVSGDDTKPPIGVRVVLVRPGDV